MRNRNGATPIAAVGGIVVLLTLAAYFLLDIERIALNSWALAFLLLSELCLFGGLISLRFAGPGKTFLKSGVTTSLSLYFAITLVSVFLSGNFIERVNTFIFIEMAIMALFAIITISVFAYSKGIESRNQEDAAKVGNNEPKRGGF